jgi:hypothetical protein
MYNTRNIFTGSKKNEWANNYDRMIFANGVPDCNCVNLWDCQYTVLHVCGEQYSTSVSYIVTMWATYKETIYHHNMTLWTLLFEEM